MYQLTDVIDRESGLYETEFNLLWKGIPSVKEEPNAISARQLSKDNKNLKGRQTNGK